MRLFLPLVLAALFCGFQGHATAGLLYSNGAPDNNNSLNMTQLREADDFNLGSAATVGSIRFWWSPGVRRTTADFSGTITYAIYQDSAGAIGSEVAVGTVSGLTFTPTGAAICSAVECPVQLTDITLTSPVGLGAGKYWLELHEGTSRTAMDGTYIFWATSNDSAGNSRRSIAACPGCGLPSTANGKEFAFELYDAQVPEPGTIGLAALGLGLVVWRKRRG